MRVESPSIEGQGFFLLIPFDLSDKRNQGLEKPLPFLPPVSRSLPNLFEAFLACWGVFSTMRANDQTFYREWERERQRQREREYIYMWLVWDEKLGEVRRHWVLLPPGTEGSIFWGIHFLRDPFWKVGDEIRWGKKDETWMERKER